MPVAVIGVVVVRYKVVAVEHPPGEFRVVEAHTGVDDGHANRFRVAGQVAPAAGKPNRRECPLTKIVRVGGGDVNVLLCLHVVVGFALGNDRVSADDAGIRHVDDNRIRLFDFLLNCRPDRHQILCPLLRGSALIKADHQRVFDGLGQVFLSQLDRGR